MAPTSQDGVAEGLLEELASLGLVRVARGEDRTYVLTSLGQQVVDRGLTEDASAVLKDVERLRTDLLSTIAHELRTPLTVVRTSTGLLLDPAPQPTDEQRTAMLETIERNAERMQRLIGDILDLARFRSGSIRLQLRRFDATELAVRRSCPPFARWPTSVARRSRSMRRDGPGPHVFGDRPRLERALLNLVSNALKFSPDGGTGQRSASASRRRAKLSWSVIDAGPGIAADDQARLFERFFVGGRTSTRPRRASASGCRRRSRSPRRTAAPSRSRAAPGRGSTFTLVVPADGPPEPASLMRILVVDDEPDVVESVRLGFTLQWREVDVLGAGTGEAALDVVEHEHPDIVLLDIGLPGHRRVRGHPPDPGVLGRPGRDAHRPRRCDGQGQGPRARRRRLRHEAVQPPRADGPRQGRAAPSRDARADEPRRRRSGPATWRSTSRRTRRGCAACASI